MDKRKVPFVRSPYNYDLEEASNEATIPADQQGESLTVQSQAEDADLNVMMKRFGVTGKMPDDVRPVFYGDFDQVMDFRTALESLQAAQDNFMKMPAEMRMRFLNDPQRFVEFCENPANLEEMRKMGLAIPKKESSDVSSGSVAGAGGPDSGSGEANRGEAGPAAGSAGGRSGAPTER